MRLLRTAGLLAAWAASLAAAGEPPGAGYEEDRELRIEVDGRPVPVLALRLSQPSAPAPIASRHARFPAAAGARVELRAAAGPVVRAELRGVRTAVPGTLAAGRAEFVLPGPGCYYLRFATPGAPDRFLVLLAEAPEPARPDLPPARIIDVVARGVRPDPARPATADLQRLLDEAAARADGTTVHFPPGVYRSGPLRIGTRTGMHLARGAVLRAVDDPAAFTDHFLLVADAHDVRLSGAGTIDGHARSLRARRPEVTRGLHGLVIRDSADVTVEGLLLRDVCDWNIHVLRSARVNVRGVKLLAHKDGLAVDGSSDVRFTDGFVQSTDDAVLVCARDPVPAERVVVRGLLLHCRGAALKVGSLTRGPIRDIRFEDCEAFDTDRGLAVETRDPEARLERIAWRRLRLGLAASEPGGGVLLRLTPVEGGGDFRLRDCVIEDVDAEVAHAAVIAGTAAAPLSGLALRDIRLAVLPPAGGRPPLFALRHVDRLPVAGLRVDWRGHRADWAGLAGGAGLEFVAGMPVETP
ncbi:MAG: hypothetical protein JNG83_10620 [Opitutaceae bacterium]|nr:hypothetical protein [Opitutaceae bacterium]